MLTGVLVSRLAALALTASLAAVTSACLVTSVDSFPDPPSTPPFLSGARATPDLNQIVLVPNPQTADPITFSAYVRSEDAGAELQALLVADWPSLSGTIDYTTLSAGSFDQERKIEFTWNPRSPTVGSPISPGCHAFTLIVSHRFNFTPNTVPARFDDADSLVWWVFIGDPSSDAPVDLTSFDLSACPSPAQPAVTP